MCSGITAEECAVMARVEPAPKSALTAEPVANSLLNLLAAKSEGLSGEIHRKF